MWIGSGIFCVFEASTTWGKEQDRTAGKQRERDRVRERERERERERPEFPKPPAPALRFGSMNPISRFLGRGSIGEGCNGPNPAWYLGKSYNAGGGTFFLPSLLQKWNLDP